MLLLAVTTCPQRLNDRERTSTLIKFLLNNVRQMEKYKFCLKIYFCLFQLYLFAPLFCFHSAARSEVLEYELPENQIPCSPPCPLCGVCSPLTRQRQPHLYLPTAHLCLVGCYLWPGPGLCQLPPMRSLVFPGLLAANFSFLSVLFSAPKGVSGEEPQFNLDSPAGWGLNFLFLGDMPCCSVSR